MRLSSGLVRQIIAIKGLNGKVLIANEKERLLCGYLSFGALLNCTGLKGVNMPRGCCWLVMTYVV
jgi:hypothetical protein